MQADDGDLWDRAGLGHLHAAGPARGGQERGLEFRHNSARTPIERENEEGKEKSIREKRKHAGDVKSLSLRFVFVTKSLSLELSDVVAESADCRSCAALIVSTLTVFFRCGTGREGGLTHMPRA